MKMGYPKGPLLGASALKEAGEEESDSAASAAADILEAIADKDSDALNLALKRHYELCAGEGDEDEDDTDEE